MSKERVTERRGVLEIPLDLSGIEREVLGGLVALSAQPRYAGFDLYPRLGKAALAELSRRAGHGDGARGLPLEATLDAVAGAAAEAWVLRETMRRLVDAGAAAAPDGARLADHLLRECETCLALLRSEGTEH